MSKNSAFTVALIGPDGAGKSTVGRQLEHVSPLPLKYVYMGVNLESSNLVLPTTRLLLEVKRMRGGRPDMAGPSDTSQSKPRPKGAVRRVAAELKSGLRLANLMAEEWFRQAVTWYYQKRGYIVLFDRHFFLDYYFHDVVRNGSERTLTRRVHGFVLERFYPKPDLVICLDAPTEVLFKRKPEGTLAALERRRQEYLEFQDIVDHFLRVDATQPEEKVAQQVADLIFDFHKTEARGTQYGDRQVGC
jgi:thymidylate kinase